MGRGITQEELDEMVRIHDLDQTGKISYNEFKRIFGHYDEGQAQPAKGVVDFDNLEQLDEEEQKDNDAAAVSMTLKSSVAIRRPQ